MRRLKFVLGLLGVLLATVSCETPFSIPITHELDGDMALGISFPPLKDERSREHSAVHLPRLGVELIRFDVQWSFREPEQGVFDWAAMDRRMEFVAGLGLKPFITFPPDAPDWLRSQLPADLLDELSVAFGPGENVLFSNYVELFLTRYEEFYPGLIRYVQFGNEWLSEYWYIGSGAQFAATQRAFHDAVKGVNPNLIVVLGGFSVGQLAALAAYNGTISSFWDGNGDTITAEQIAEEIAAQEAALAAGEIDETVFGRLAAVLDEGYYDWVDAHLYDQYEQWDEYVAALRSALPVSFDGSVVCTEFGGPHPVIEARISNEEHGLLVQEYIRALDQLDLEFALHFHLVRSPVSLHDRSGLMRIGIFGPRELPAYEVFGRINNPGAGWE